MAFQSTHKLDFLCCPWERDPEWSRFKIGTCSGLWRSTETYYDILAIDNEEPGNGHLQDVFDWFENSCKRDNKDLRIMELLNLNFKTHLVYKRGFAINGQNAIKPFRTPKPTSIPIK